MFGRFRKGGVNLSKIENLGLPTFSIAPVQDKNAMLCGIIRKEAILPDELNTTDFTKEQRKKRTEALQAQQEMDDQVLSVQLDASRMEDSFDPIPEVIRDYPNDPDMDEFFMIKTEGLIKSQLEIIDDHLNKAVSANYNDFLAGIKLIQEIDLDLSRSDIYVQNTRRMLEQSKKTITIPGLSIAHQRRRELRLRQVKSVVESFQELSQVESMLHHVVESGDIIKGVEIASQLESMIMSEGLMQYTCLDSMRTRIEDLWPQLKEKLIQNIREQLIAFDPTVYTNIFRTYSVLDAHLTAMKTQKLKKQQLDETASNRSLLKRTTGEDGRPGLTQSASTSSVKKLIVKQKNTKKEGYVDVVQKCACSVITDICESELKKYLLQSKETILPRDLVMQMGYMQLCASVKTVELPRAMRCVMNSIANVLHNFYLLCQWHRYPFEEKANNLDVLHMVNVMENEDNEIGREEDKDTELPKMEDREGVSGVTFILVRRKLRTSRRSVWQHCQRMINDFLDCSKLDNGNTHVTKQVVINDLCTYFMKIGEVFCGSTSDELKLKLSQKQCRYVDQMHRNIIEVFKNSLETEMWQPFPMKLAEMNGFPGLLQSTLLIPDEDNMFLKSSSSNVQSIFMNWRRDGNCFEEGKKLQLISAKVPEIANSIDNALILTGVGINAFIKSVNKYLDLMANLPLAADFVFAKLLYLVDFYVYAVTTLFAPQSVLNTLFVTTDGSAIYPFIVPFIRRCQKSLFPAVSTEDEDANNLAERLTPTSESEDQGIPQPVLTVDESLIEEDLEIRRIIAAESTRLFTALFDAIKKRVLVLAPISRQESIQQYIICLPDITQDLCKMFYRASSHAILKNLDGYKPLVIKQKWEIRNAKCRDTDYVSMIKTDLTATWDVIDGALNEGRFTALCVSRFWRVVMGVILEELLVSFSAVKKCSQEGREQMSIDTNSIYNHATSLCDIQPADDSKDLKYVLDYIMCCKLEEPSDVIAWTEKHGSEYGYDVVMSIVNYAMAKKLNKQKLKDLKDTIHSMFTDVTDNVEEAVDDE